MGTLFIFKSQYSSQPGLGAESLIPEGDLFLRGFHEPRCFTLIKDRDKKCGLKVNNGSNKICNLRPFAYLCKFSQTSKNVEMQFEISAAGNERVYMEQTADDVIPILKAYRYITVDTREFNMGTFRVKFGNKYLKHGFWRKEFKANRVYKKVKLIGEGTYELETVGKWEQNNKVMNREIGGGTTIIIEPPDGQRDEGDQ